jgi:hypothetical protein
MAADSTREMTEVLARALWALGDAGQPTQAGTLAAAGWSAVHHAPPTTDPTRELTRLLARALLALAEAGEPTRAGTLATAGWETLRHDRPVDAERLTGLLRHPSRLSYSASDDGD